MAKIQNISEIHPVLGFTEFDVLEKYMVQLIPSVQNHLRERLHNRKITMTVRVSAPTENIRAYSHVERFQMMSKKNPNLLKLKEALGLELS